MTLSLRDFMSDAGISKWVTALGVADAPAPRRNIGAALTFFASYMPHLAPDMALNFIRAMDISKDVRPVYLAAGDRLIAFRLPTESPFKLFFARRGASPHHSGIDPTDRAAVHFVVRAPLMALQSYTTGAIDTWTRRTGTAIAPRAGTYGVLASGGGLQVLVPDSYIGLLVQTQ
jgi:hypothetical protein